MIDWYIKIMILRNFYEKTVLQKRLYEKYGSYVDLCGYELPGLTCFYVIKMGNSSGLLICHQKHRTIIIVLSFNMIQLQRSAGQ